MFKKKIIITSIICILIFGIFTAICLILPSNPKKKTESGGKTSAETTVSQATTTEIETTNSQASATETETTVPQASTTQTDAPEPEQTTTSSPEFDSNNNEDIITVAMTGDILLSDKLYERYSQGGLTGFLSPAVKDALYNADLTFINQEFPFSNRGTPEPGKEYTYCVPTSYVSIFQELDIDVVSISNNHILDYGQDALADTFTTLEAAQIDYIGGGRNLERAKQLITKQVKGKTIGFLAASRVVPSGAWYATDSRAGVFTTYDDTALCEEIKKANEICDVVIVYAHWGIERETIACDYQRTMARHYIDAGADFVVGSHPHVMQGVEYYNGVPIVYSLGNFLFSNYYSRTTVLTLSINQNNQCSIDFLPCGSQTYYTYDCDQAGIDEFYSFLNSVSFDCSFGAN